MLYNEVFVYMIQLDVELLHSHVVSELGLEAVWHCWAFIGHLCYHVSEDAALIGVKLFQAERASFSLSIGNRHAACQANQICKHRNLLRSEKATNVL